jgi:hypothetical protein
MSHVLSVLSLLFGLVDFEGAASNLQGGGGAAGSRIVVLARLNRPFGGS